MPPGFVVGYLFKVSQLFPCSSKRFLNFRLSGTRLLIKWFLIKNAYSHWLSKIKY